MTRYTIPTVKVPRGGGQLLYFLNIIDCACVNSYNTTKRKLSRRQFLLQLIRKLYKSKNRLACVTSYPPVAQISSTAFPAIGVRSHQAGKRKNCQFVVSCRNKSICKNCENVPLIIFVLFLFIFTYSIVLCVFFTIRKHAKMSSWLVSIQYHSYSIVNRSL